jgi:DNA-binding NarL/FixJ family response regulator
MQPDERPTIRVVLVDDHPLILEGTRSTLAQAVGISVVGLAGDGKTALQLVAEHQPDVLILDIHLPDMSGVEVAERVRSAWPEVAVLVISGYSDRAYIRQLMKKGIRGYLSKTALSDELVAAVRTVAGGNSVFPATTANAVLHHNPELLTPREHDVLQLIANGRSNSQISGVLCVSASTVEFHVRQILQKLGVRSRTQAVIKAHQQGLLSLDDSALSS